MTGFVSTRGGTSAALREVVFSGLAPDGGLFLPARVPSLPGPPLPQVSWPSSEQALEDLVAVSAWAAPSFLPALPPDVVQRLVRRSLTFPIHCRELEPHRFVLELFHGPTHAFKDVGARFLAALMAELRREGDQLRTVLVATSGDTGGAVADAFHGLEGFRVAVLFPAEGVSQRQRRQMTTLGGNVHALSVNGSFDDCQRLVKSAFLDGPLARRHGLTSANSINIGRLLPQALYYVYAWLVCQSAARVSRGGESRARPTFVVPCGNLGNLSAGLLAKRAGMSVNKFVAASNENRGFVDFLNGAEFEPRSSIATPSNAMDVGVPSNLERILWLYGNDSDAVRNDVAGVSVTAAEAAERLARVFAQTGYVLDPHSAVAFEAGMRHHAAADEPVVVLATAHPAKFPETVESMIGAEVPLPEGLRRTRIGAERIHHMEPEVGALRAWLKTVPS